MIVKIFVGFLLGFIIGVGGTVFMVTSGAGNYIIAANPRVQELEAKVREVEGQREFVTRRLEEVARLTERMADRFEDLEDRFSTMERTRQGEAPATSATPAPEAQPPGDAPAPTG